MEMLVGVLEGKRPDSTEFTLKMRKYLLRNLLTFMKEYKFIFLN